MAFFKKKISYSWLVLVGSATLFIGMMLVFSVKNQAGIERIGVTFSTQYIECLELDIEKVYTDILKELRPDAIRLPVYWSDIELSSGEYDFTQLDWLMDTAYEYDIPITLAIGVKVPRWPECFVPEWAIDSNGEGIDDEAFFSMLSAVVERYKDHPALERWQIENEPFFPFGECPAPDSERFIQSLTLVRTLDQVHPIGSTTSGEQSLWFMHTAGVDILGVSLYREVVNQIFGTIVFPHSPFVYRVQRLLAEPFVDKVIVSELQMEPWILEDLSEMQASAQTLYNLFPIEDMVANWVFVEQTGVDEVYFWGVEWWYYLKEQGEDRLWNQVKKWCL